MNSGVRGRNPDGQALSIWCYTTDKEKKWELCNPVPSFVRYAVWKRVKTWPIPLAQPCSKVHMSARHMLYYEISQMKYI